MSGVLSYKNPKEFKIKEARKVNTEESETLESEFKLSKAETSKEIWIY
jgi:hypothetical protein